MSYSKKISLLIPDEGDHKEGPIQTDFDRPNGGASSEEREWLRTTLSCIGDAVITTDSNDNVTLLNPVAQSLTGWTQEEAHGVPLESILTIVNEDNRLPVESPTVSALRNGVVVGLTNHTLLVSKDGTERAIDHTAAPIRNVAGKVAGAVLVFRDVTERRGQEKAVQAALAYADNIIATLREPFAVLDKSLRVQTANASFYRTFHVLKNETENHSLFVLGNGQWDNPRLRKLLSEILSDQHAVEDFEVEHVFPTIGRKVMLLNARRISSQDGNSDLILLAIEDVTERRRVEETLRQAEAAVQTALTYADNIIATLREPFVVLDKSLRVQKANGSFYRAFHVSEKETENYLLFELGNGQWNNPRLRTLLAEILSGHHVVEDFEVEHTFPIIGRKAMLLNARRLVSQDGGLDLILLAIEDVTERKNLENQLRQAQKMEAVGQLAGGVAHDFNNLLTIISGYSEILLAELRVADPMRAPVKAISEAGGRAASLTRQLVAFSRQTMLEPKVLDLGVLVKDTCEMLCRLIGDDILLTTVLEPTLSLVKVDAGQLDQVLMNLAVNARDAMPTGGKLSIEGSNVELGEHEAASHSGCAPGRYVLLALSDTGCGMSAEVKAHIFEPFFTTKGVGKGTGLGLATVFGIVKQSGGVIEVHSELGFGTKFNIYLPAMTEQPTSSQSFDRGIGVGGTETVLLVEDEDGVRGLALLVLQANGYKVLVGRDGRDALRIVEKHIGGIDLLVTDVVMPGMGGRELADALCPRFPQMKLLFSSGYTKDAVVRHGVLHESVAFLQKPYLPLSLTRKVREVLDKKD